MFNPSVVVGEVSASRLDRISPDESSSGVNSVAERAGLNMTAKRNVVGFEVLTAATEEYYLLECDVVSGRISLKFRRKVLLPSSMSRSKPNKQTQAAS
jgi:hypothetical protein